MRMHDPASWEGLGGAAALAKLVADGKAVELAVTAKWMDAKAFAIDAQAFDRFVVWDGEATRRHLVHLDEADRLVSLIEASATAAFGMGGCFVCRAVDARGYRAQPERHLLTITNYGSRTEPPWLVHA